MSPARIRPEELSDFHPRSGTVWLHACSGDSSLLRAGLTGAGQDLSGLIFTGIFVPGLNPMGPLLAAGARFRSYFMLPEMLAAPDQVEYLPLPYRNIRRDLTINVPYAALMMVSPPDEEGNCSFGPVNDFIADIWESIPVRIAHVNPRLPRTNGRSIPYEALTAVIEGESELPESDPGTDEVSRRIAALAAEIIPEGATLQAGLGRTPEAVLRGLTGHRGLSIHSGLIGDSTLNLLESGALRDRNPITAGVAIGTRRLYDSVGNPAFQFAPPSVTHDIRTLAAIDTFVTVNSAVEVDLSGQVFAEATPKGYISGPGGASDFAAGARGMMGLRIIVLPATAAKGTVSRIVAKGAATGPVSLGRFDTDVVITEFGRADLRGLSHEGRRKALIAIAAPEHREALERG